MTANGREAASLSTVRPTEISATALENFADAVSQGVSRAAKTLRNIKGASIKEQEVVVDNDSVNACAAQERMTFVLDDQRDRPHILCAAKPPQGRIAAVRGPKGCPGRAPPCRRYTIERGEGTGHAG